MKPLSKISPAIDRVGTHTLGDVAKAIVDGKAQHWKGRRSEIVTEIQVFPTMKICRIWLAGGEIKELVGEMLPSVEAWAKSKGCDRIQILGRKGWVRVLKDYSEPYSVLEKEIG